MFIFYKNWRRRFCSRELNLIIFFSLSRTALCSLDARGSRQYSLRDITGIASKIVYSAQICERDPLDFFSLSINRKPARPSRALKGATGATGSPTFHHRFRFASYSSATPRQDRRQFKESLNFFFLIIFHSI